MHLWASRLSKGRWYAFLTASGASPSEIDLVQLFQQLWASKWLIALIAALATAAALAYALLAVPTYQVDVLLRPIQTKALEAVNVNGLYALTPREALDRVGNELAAYSGRLEYFEAHPELFQQLNAEGLSPSRLSGSSTRMPSACSRRT